MIQGLSQEQQLAATSSRHQLLIVAPPGCGKTEVLAHRAAHQVKDLEQNQRVLALTFTKRARSNLEERLRAVLGQSRARKFVVVRNLHGFAAHVVTAHGRTIGLESSGVELPKTSTMRKAMEATGGGGPTMYDAERILSEVKRKPRSDAEVLTAIERLGAGPAVDLAHLIEASRQESAQLHYDDLLRHAQRLLRIPAVAHLYQAHFGAVLVDEFQDLSMQQLDVAMRSCTSQRTFAGDPLQGIYSWAGAEPSRVESVVRRVCQDPIRLKESYRSSPRVLDTVNSISELIDPGSKLISAEPHRWGDGGCTAALVFEDRIAEARTIVSTSCAILEGDPTASIGVIVRAAWRRGDIDAASAASPSLPVRRWDLAIDDPAVVALIQSTVAALPSGATLADARAAVVNGVDPADVDARELVESAFDTLDRSDAKTARAAVRTIRTSDPNQAVGPGLHLLNAHTGKGQQFDWVFVVGLEEDHIPGKRNNAGLALAEEQRVLLVMLSRARRGLVLTRTRSVTGWYGPKAVAANRWWTSLRTEMSTPEEVRAHLTSAEGIAVPSPAGRVANVGT